AFKKLKKAMMEALVLGLPNFDQEFVIETDASGTGIGAVLCQKGHPLAYLSKTLATKHQGLSTHEKEFMAMVAALDKWKGYLLHRHFKIRTDHFSLKYLMNQKLTTPFQHKWLPKLLGYDYEIMYKKGVDNGSADALSRVNQGAPNSCYYKGDKLTLDGDLLKRKGRIMVGNDVGPRKQLIAYFHEGTVGGHSGVLECDVCQRQKPDLSAYPGLLQPLPIPGRIWAEVSMDFIEKLPNSQGKTVIMVVVDMLSKYAHFMPLSHPFNASQVAQVFLDGVYKLHGLPESISREEAINMLKFHMKRAQDRIKTQADKHRTEREFEVGTWVYLKLQHHRQVTVRQGQQHNLYAKYHGPFLIVKRVGQVAYRDHQMGSLPQLREDGLLDYKPMAILERRLGKLEDKLLFKEDGIDTRQF
nr:retrotransposon-related protein [Tanacetum cinerariifolium]